MQAALPVGAFWGQSSSLMPAFCGTKQYCKLATPVVIRHFQVKRILERILLSIALNMASHFSKVELGSEIPSRREHKLPAVGLGSTWEHEVLRILASN